MADEKIESLNFEQALAELEKNRYQSGTGKCCSGAINRDL